MKKYIYLAFATLACMLASCQKEDDAFSVVQPVEPLVFHASIASDTTKTTIEIVGDKGKFSWVQADQVTVTRTSDGATAVYTADQSGATSDFTYSSGAVFSDENDNYYATYGDINHQTYSADGANCPLAAPAQTGTHFIFTASAAMLKFNVKADNVAIKEVRCEGKVLTCNPAVALNTSTGTDFYLAVPAGTYPHLAFTFVANDGKVCTKTAKNSMLLEVNHIQPITLGSALTFSEPVYPVIASYYNATTAITDPALEGGSEPCGFTVTTVTDGDGSFKHQFPGDAAHAAVYFNEGDCIEAKVHWDKANSENGSPTNSRCSIFTIGSGSAYGGEGSRSILSSITWDGTHKEYHMRFEVSGGILLGSSFTLQQVTSSEDDASGVIWIKVSQAGGLQYKLSESAAWTQIVDASNTYLAEVLARGVNSSDALYIGTYHHPETVTYDYLRITRDISIPVSSITLNPPTLTLTPGGMSTIVATVAPADATYEAVRYTSSNTAVATVNASGVVTAVASGRATITATATDGSNVEATCAVTVTGALFFDAQGNQYNYEPEGWDLHGEIGNAASYGQFQIPAINWANGDYIEIQLQAGSGGTPFILGNSASFWTPNANNARALFIQGQAWPLVKCKNEGDYTQVQTLFNAGEALATANMTVRISADLVEVQKRAGAFEQIPCTLLLQNESTLYIGGKSDAADGHINYIKIVRGSGGSSFVAATGVSLSSNNLALVTGGTSALTATVSPANASNKNVTWSTSDPTVATVSDGTVTAVGTGSATITATATGGSNVTATCAVTVNAAPPIGDIVYFNASGAQFSTAQSFSAAGGFQFQLPAIGWSNGDYIEVEFTRTTGQNNCSYYLIGNSTAFTYGTNYNGAYCVALNGDGWAKLNKCDGTWVDGNTFLNAGNAWHGTFVIRISQNKVEYKEDSNAWQTVNTPLALQTCGQTLYLGTRDGGGNAVTGVTYNYIKWVKGSGGTPDPQQTVWNLKSIAVKTAPTTTTYTVGDALDLTGLVISATYEDADGVESDKTEDLASSAWTASPANGATLNTAGSQTITITATEDNTKTCTTNVTVNAASVPEGTYYLTKAGATSSSPAEFSLTAAESFKISIPDFSLSTADLEIKVSNELTNLYYLTIGADTNNQLPYASNYVYLEASASGTNGWKTLHLGNQGRTVFANGNCSSITIKLTSGGFYYKMDSAANFTQVSAATSEVISEFIALQNWYICAIQSNHACTINYIKVTPVELESGSVQSSSAAAITNTTKQGW